MTDKELISIANMELRDQLEAERVKVKKLEERIDKVCNKLHAIEMILRYQNNICADSIGQLELYLTTGVEIPFNPPKIIEVLK